MSDDSPKNKTGKAVSDSSPSPPASDHPSPTGRSGILPPQHWAQLAEFLKIAEELDVQHDGDSAITGIESSTASITSSILQYRTLHGRKYHSDQGKAEYWGTVDGDASEAMDINHHVLTLLLDGNLYLAPLKEDIQVKKVVDIGTGTGIWAIDFADEFPNASIIGTDISPIQPTWVPPNLEFQIDDCTQDWTFQENSIDYIHTRWLVGSIADWTSLFKQAYKSLKPGGYLESYEPSSCVESDDGTVGETSALNQWGKFFVEGGLKIGRPFTLFEDEIQRKAMEEAGFVDIEEHNVRFYLHWMADATWNPIGSWPKDPKLREIGMFMQLAFEKDPEGAVLFMATTLGWTREEVAVYLTHFRREIRSKDIHAYYWQKVVWGRKPRTA